MRKSFRVKFGKSHAAVTRHALRPLMGRYKLAELSSGRPAKVLIKVGPIYSPTTLFLQTNNRIRNNTSHSLISTSLYTVADMRKPMPTSNRKVLMYVYTAAAITITIGGSLYGAELASKQEKKKVCTYLYHVGNCPKSYNHCS